MLRIALFPVFLLSALLLTACTADSPGDTSSAKVESLLDQGDYIPDIATFLNIGNCNLAGHSWDGHDVYIRSGMSGTSQIYRLTDDGWPYQLTTFEDGVDFFTLSYNGDLAVIGASVGGSEQSQLFLMDTKTGRVLQLTSADDTQYGSVTWAKDDKSIFFRSNEENKRDFFIYRMDIVTAKYDKVLGIEGWNAIADLSKDGNWMLVYHAVSNVANDLVLLDLSTGEHRTITENDGNIAHESPTLMPDNKTIWLACNGNDDGILRLAKMTVDSPEIEYVDDGWLDPKWPIDGLAVSRDYKYMTATTNEDGYGRLKLRDLATGRELPSPPMDGMVIGGSFDRNGVCLLSFNSPTRAPDVWRWNPATSDIEQLTFSIYAGIDRNLFTEPELIHYTSFDGLEIPAFLYLPPGYKKGERIPFVVSAHGGPEGQYRPYFQRNIQYLILNGFGVLAPNPRGSSGYGVHYLSLDNYKNRKHSLQDYKAGVDWLIENGYSQKGMLGIRGGSYGGYVVLGMITEYPNLFSAAVDNVGIANFKTFLENTRPYRRALREAEYGPLSDPEFLREISPIHKAHLIKTPLLVVHGENDPRVPVGEARQIIRAIKKSGGVVDSLIFADEGHGASKRVNVIAEYRRQIAFFNQHLKPQTISTDRKEM